MNLKFLAAGASLVLLLAACGPKQEAKAPSSAAKTEAAAPVAPAAPAAALNPAPAAQTPSQEHRFAAKTGRIEFAMTGLQAGTETLIWDDWGARQVTITKSSTSMGGTSIAQNQRVITVPGSSYIVDDGAKTVMKIDLTADRPPGMTDQSLREMSEQMMKSMGAEKSGDDLVAGKTCDVWTMKQMNMNACIWSGVPLKTEGNLMGMAMSKVATKVEENVAVDGALFDVPAGYAQQEAPSVDFSKIPMPQMQEGAAPIPAPPSNN